MSAGHASIDEQFPLTDGRVELVPVAEGMRLRIIDRQPTALDTSLPPVLLVHGLASNARMWDGAGSALSRQGIRSVAVDLRGHGRSDKPDDGYDFSTVVGDLAALLETLGIARAVFVGQSWGGNVVVHAAHERPDVVVGAVAVDGGMIELGRNFSSWDDCASALRPPNLIGTRFGRMEAAMRSMNADWPESGIVGALSNFEVLTDGTIRPWLTLERHLKILHELWTHRPSDFFHRILGGDHNAAIGHFRQRGNGRIAGTLTNFFISAIHQMQPARIARQRADGTIREGTRARGSADHGNRGRVEQPLHIGMAINAALGDGHCLASSCSAGLMRQSGL